MSGMIQQLRTVFELGGPVMYPLLFLSLLSLTLIFERSVFWARMTSRGRTRRWGTMTAKLRRGDVAGAKALAEADGTVLGWFGRNVIESLESGSLPAAPAAAAGGQGAFTEAAARDLIESVRGPIERFGSTLSTTITAAPMLGILGTVLGIIKSFGLLGGAEVITDPSVVADGIAQALYTTAFGLTIALVTLFPYAIFRAQSDRAFSRLEAFAAAAIEAGSDGQIAKTPEGQRPSGSGRRAPRESPEHLAASREAGEARP
jgi:biopolymer transport protein ExbB